jgi:predicted nucleic acid-binding protein
MIVVLDVSAAIEILLKREKKDIFLKKYEKGTWVIAPDLYIYELSNVLWKYHKANILSHEDCVQIVEDGINLIDDFFEGVELWKESLGESIKYNHSVYDLNYAILTRRNDGILLTNDKSLSKICQKMKVSVCS